MSWLWKDKPQEKTKIEFTTTHGRHNKQRSQVRVTLELDMEYPVTLDVADVIRSVRANFDLPQSIEILTADIAHIEIMDESDV